MGVGEGVGFGEGLGVGIGAPAACVIVAEEILPLALISIVAVRTKGVLLADTSHISLPPDPFPDWVAFTQEYEDDDMDHS